MSVHMKLNDSLSFSLSGCSKKGTVGAELGQQGLFATDRATNSLACISTSACLQWPTRRVGVPASAPTDTMNRRPRCDQTECDYKADNWGNILSIREQTTTNEIKQGDRQIGEPQPLFLHSILPSSIHPWTLRRKHIWENGLLFCVWKHALTRRPPPHIW